MLNKVKKVIESFNAHKENTKMMQQSALLPLALLLISCGVAFACHGKLIGKYTLGIHRRYSPASVPIPVFYFASKSSINCAPFRPLAAHAN